MNGKKPFLFNKFRILHTIPRSEGLVVDLEYMLDRYYSLREWDQQGIPTSSKLKSLDLADLIKDL